MKTSILKILAPLLLVSLNLNSQNAERTLVRAFNLQGNHTVTLAIDGNVDVQTWNQDEMRVLMTINLPKGSDIMLKNLVKVGRYNLASETDATGLKVFAPGLDKQVKLRSGAELEEDISMVVYVPQNVQVTSNEMQLADRDNENK